MPRLVPILTRSRTRVGGRNRATAYFYDVRYFLVVYTQSIWDGEISGVFFVYQSLFLHMENLLHCWRWMGTPHIRLVGWEVRSQRRLEHILTRV